MPLKIVRNDITKMNTEAIVNTANAHVTVGPGCDSAIYKAAGHDELLKYRKDDDHQSNIMPFPVLHQKVPRNFHNPDCKYSVPENEVLS